MRRRAAVHIRPGLRLATDVEVLSAYTDHDLGESYVILSGDYLPPCDRGQIPLRFTSMANLLAYCWEHEETGRWGWMEEAILDDQ